MKFFVLQTSCVTHNFAEKQLAYQLLLLLLILSDFRDKCDK